MKYDYIIAGSGAAGLSLLHYLLNSPALSSKKILLIDREKKQDNDRTWCFWEVGVGEFDHLLAAQWDSLNFYSPDFSKRLEINPYRYKMLRSREFYQYCLDKASQFGNVEIKLDTITHIGEDGKVWCGEKYDEGQYVFSSLPQKPVQKANTYYMLQHFKGWFIEMEDEVFDAEAATLMDFRIPQEGDCRFVYVLPLSGKKALVEYTVFSGEVLKQEDYDERLLSYLADVFPTHKYQVLEEEFGVIPMTNAAFPKQKGNRVFYIGTAGGHTKASTGYTFRFVQRECQKIVKRLEEGRIPVSSKPFEKYHWYDTLFLRVLEEKKIPSHTVFTSLFSKLPPQLPLKFLDESTNMLEDLRVMNAVDKVTFLTAAVKEFLPV